MNYDFDKLYSNTSATRPNEGPSDSVAAAEQPCSVSKNGPLQIDYVSAPCGAGKTHSIIEEIHNLIGDGGRVILCQPITRLIDETASNFKKKYSHIFCRTIHGQGAVGAIMKHLESPFPEPHVLIITYEAFQRLEFIRNRQTWHLIIDEIPQAFDCFDESIPRGHRMITDHLEIIDSPDEGYSFLFAPDKKPIRRIIEDKKDKILPLFKPLAVRIESHHWSNYVQTKVYTRLCSKNSGRLTVFSFLKPSIFEGFKSVLIVGAFFEESLFYLSFSKQGVTFRKSARIKPRFSEHQNGSTITFCYALDRPWSKALRNKGEGGQLWTKLIKGVKRQFEGKDFVWSANKDVADDLLGKVAAGKRLPQAALGLNEFSEFDNVAFLSAHNLIPAHAAFIQVHLAVNRTAVETAVHRQHAYQAIMRTSLRDPDNLNPKRVFVPDRPTAQWLHEKFPGSTLQPLDFGFELKPNVRGRPKIHGTNAEKTKAYRKRLEAQLDEHIRSLFSNEENPSFDIQIGCDENTINSSNIVTPRVSLFKNKESTVAYAYIKKYTLNKFEEFLMKISRETFPSKEANRLLSPSIFDPDKSFDTSRGNDNFVTANSIWLDFDGGDLTPDDFAKVFPELRITIFNTSSSKKDDLRFRAFIPLSSDVTLEIYKGLTGHIEQRLCAAGFVDKKESGDGRKTHGLDTGKMGPASLFYLPCQADDPSGNYFKVFKKGRKVLQVSDWIGEIVLKDDGFDSALSEDSDRKFESNRPTEKRIEEAISKWQSAASIPGVGNVEFFRLAGSLAAAGCSEAETVAILSKQAMDARHPDERKKEIPQIIRSLRKKNAF